MVGLYNSGKSRYEISAEYNLSSSSIYNWVRAYKRSGSVQVESKVATEQKEIGEKYKRILQLEIENDTLKQAELIMWRM